MIGLSPVCMGSGPKIIVLATSHSEVKIMAGNKLEQLIRDFLAVGRELIEILRSLDDVE